MLSSDNLSFVFGIHFIRFLNLLLNADLFLALPLVNTIISHFHNLVENSFAHLTKFPYLHIFTFAFTFTASEI